VILALFRKERVYEGTEFSLNAVHPMPYLSEIFIDEQADAATNIFGIFPANTRLFREDFFDPNTRIKRGRFYVMGSPSKTYYSEDRVNHHPYASPFFPCPQLSSVDRQQRQVFPMNFDIFCSFNPGNIKNIRRLPTVFLGGKDFGTPWRIVDAERLYNGETLFTLKSLSALGTLPELIEEKLPEERKKEIRDGFQKIVDVAPIQIAESVVDVCREFARLLLAAWLPTVGVAVANEDLGGLVRIVLCKAKDRKGIANAASVINRLHPRGKSSERELHPEIRPLADEDASLAVSLIGFLLRDFGWAA
jgi:hypothetical protein